jgi:thiamine-phosphate pyrophosphorylase
MGKRKIDFNLYLITDRNLVTRHSSLVTAVRQALKGGVMAVQVREKDIGTRDLLKLAHRMRELTERFQAKLFINDRFDIALAVGADKDREKETVTRRIDTFFKRSKRS